MPDVRQASFLRITQSLPDALRPRFLQHRVTERDIRKRQPAVPQQNGLAVALAPWLASRDDFTQFRMQRALGQFPRFHMRAQASELSRLALPPIVDDHLVHDVGE